MNENIFFISMKKNKIKKIAKKCFSVFGEAHGSPLNTLKFVWQKVLFFFMLLKKYICHCFKKKITKIAEQCVF